MIAGEILSHPLAPLTSWHIGGPAERFYSPPDLPSLVNYMRDLPKTTPVTWLGLGSNVLIREGGIKGAVIGSRQLQQLASEADGTIVAQAGVTCAKLARFSSRLGYAKAAFFAGIPGTVGGALAMNAGAFGGETWEWVQAAQVMNREGECFYRLPEEYEIGYRSVKGKNPEQIDEVFIGAIFRFPHQSDSDGMEQIRALLRKRAETQPIGTLNCGSVYRNPPNDFAARLIEACNLKGYCVGDAMVSPKHANFIINCAQACAQDVETLMATIESEVQARFGISLHAEVKILGVRID
jgi:UDP-N-acetylmuramate dehydrogenase